MDSRRTDQHEKEIQFIQSSQSGKNPPRQLPFSFVSPAFFVLKFVNQWVETSLEEKTNGSSQRNNRIAVDSDNIKLERSRAK